MSIEFYEKHLKSMFDLSVATAEGSIVEEGLITCRESRKKYPIINAIPRFVDLTENYTQSFGFQWNKFYQTQLDSHVKLSLSKDRLFSNTKWTPAEIRGKTILEVGSGAGRFTEVLLNAGADVYSFDFSYAVEANYRNNGYHPRLFLFQGNIYDVPFPDNYFDFVFCFGVLQHTPDPALALKKIFAKLKPGGKISLDYYLNHDNPTVWTAPKYFWRKRTIKVEPSLLLQIIRVYIFFWFPIDTLIKLSPFNLGYKILARIPLPCYNYLGHGLTYWQRLDWAILDTFDALSAQYDFPKTRFEFEEMISTVGGSDRHIFPGSNGLVANLIKA
jgi:SAM-dependent methyltransferase